MKGENAFIIKGIRRQRHQNDMFLSPSSHMIIYWWKAKRVIVNKNNLSCESSFLHSDFQLQRKKSTEMSGAFLGDYIITTLRRETFLCRTASRGFSKQIELISMGLHVLSHCKLSDRLSATPQLPWIFRFLGNYSNKVFFLQYIFFPDGYFCIYWIFKCKWMSWFLWIVYVEDIYIVRFYIYFNQWGDMVYIFTKPVEWI